MSRFKRVGERLYEFKLPPGQKSAGRATAQSLFYQGLAAANEGNMELALGFYQQSLSYDPSMEGAWLNLGIAWEYRQNWISAEESYRQALRIQPKYALAHYNLAGVLEARGYSQEALGHYLEVLMIDSQYADAHYNLAGVYKHLGEVRLAIKHYRLFLERGGDDGSFFARLARREIQSLQPKDLAIVPKSVAIYEH